MADEYRTSFSGVKEENMTAGPQPAQPIGWLLLLMVVLTTVVCTALVFIGYVIYAIAIK
jgi:hypothetical protein